MDVDSDKQCNSMNYGPFASPLANNDILYEVVVHIPDGCNLCTQKETV